MREEDKNKLKEIVRATAYRMYKPIVSLSSSQVTSLGYRLFTVPDIFGHMLSFLDSDSISNAVTALAHAKTFRLPENVSSNDRETLPIGYAHSKNMLLDLVIDYNLPVAANLFNNLKAFPTIPNLTREKADLIFATLFENLPAESKLILSKKLLRWILEQTSGTRFRHEYALHYLLDKIAPHLPESDVTNFASELLKKAESLNSLNRYARSLLYFTVALWVHGENARQLYTWMISNLKSSAIKIDLWSRFSPAQITLFFDIIKNMDDSKNIMLLTLTAHMPKSDEINEKIARFLGATLKNLEVDLATTYAEIHALIPGLSNDQINIVFDSLLLKLPQKQYYRAEEKICEIISDIIPRLSSDQLNRAMIQMVSLIHRENRVTWHTTPREVCEEIIVANPLLAPELLRRMYITAADDDHTRLVTTARQLQYSIPVIPVIACSQNQFLGDDIRNKKETDLQAAIINLNILAIQYHRNLEKNQDLKEKIKDALIKVITIACRERNTFSLPFFQAKKPAASYSAYTHSAQQLVRFFWEAAQQQPNGMGVLREIMRDALAGDEYIPKRPDLQLMALMHKVITPLNHPKTKSLPSQKM